MPIRPLPFITLKVDKSKQSEYADGEHDSNEAFEFEINEEAANLLSSIDDPISVCMEPHLW